MTRFRAALAAACAAALILISVPGGAQQVLVPAQPGRTVQVVRPVRPVAPDWFESNRVLDVIRAQELPQPASRSPSGLGGGEAAKVYQNHLLGIGQPPLGSSDQSGFGPSGGFGGSKGSSYGGSQ